MRFAEDSQSSLPPALDIKPSLLQRCRRIVVGRAKDVEDTSLFHHLSLIAFFAWIGLGADGLSSSAYGPQEAYVALGEHPYLAIFVALASVVTIFVISTSYSQIIELFPSGGGGYLVATKLLSPGLGALSGCALLVDYILTITISIASGADALFSFLPPYYAVHFKFAIAMIGVLVLTLLNMRGVKESVLPLVPIFLIFLITHAAAIIYAVCINIPNLNGVMHDTMGDVRAAHTSFGGGWIGLFIMFKLMLMAYSMGAGTYTGIEAVSNGLQILREPRVRTAKRTMRYMAWSLSIVVLGLMLLYLLFHVDTRLMYNAHGDQVKTLNAVLLEKMTLNWGSWGSIFLYVTLFSEAALLFVAAQTGFMDGPRVLSNMALDNWMPKRFATLSDRFVTQNGVLGMGVAAAIMMLFSHGDVGFLVVLYSINVFMTFVLSQTGMVRHWWQVRRSDSSWIHKITINGVGLIMCSFILATVVTLKFHQGGWITLVVTGVLVAAVFGIRQHYRNTAAVLKRLDGLVRVAQTAPAAAPASAGQPPTPTPAFDPSGKTAVVLVNGFSGVGLHTLFSIVRLFSGIFKNFVFVQIGAIDAGIFKGADEIQALKEQVAGEGKRYVDFMNQNGFYAEAVSAVGVDIVEGAVNLAPGILERFPQSVFFGGQLVFPTDSILTRFLHNYTVFALQRKFYLRGIPFVILPIRV